MLHVHIFELSDHTVNDTDYLMVWNIHFPHTVSTALKVKITTSLCVFNDIKLGSNAIRERKKLHKHLFTVLLLNHHISNTT